MKRRRPRALDPEETALWERVARTANPMEKRKKAPAPLIPAMPPAKAPPKPEPPALKPFRIGETAAQPQIAPRQPAPQAPAMDRKAFVRMKRGKSRPEARLDLHGMTLADAEGALAQFIFRAHGQGKRLVLVITGKGRDRDDGGPIPVRTGILRRQVPEWLTRPPLSAVVLEVTEAHQRHGGAGALYVYLRRA